jgi:small-conductance mechanosensitive channel
MKMPDVDWSSIPSFLMDATGSATPLQWLWQVLAIAAALVIGYLFTRLVCRRVPPDHGWRFGKHDIGRVIFPFAALLLTGLAELVLGRFQPVSLVNAAKALLWALFVIRLAVFVLSAIIPEGALLRAAVRIIAGIAWIGVVLHVTGLLPDVIDALNDIGFKVGKNKQEVTLWLALQAAAALVVTLAVALWLGRLTETRVLAAKSLQMSTRIVISKLVRAAALLIAVLVALPMVGIDITTLSIFSGALAVGMGFGLQKIASNYVSGFIVLLDNSLRIGDVVTVDGRRGEVKAIESRYTVIKGGDGVESIIPNELLITQSVSHHTFTDTKVSMVVNVSVTYSSDVQHALALLVEASGRQARVIDEPKSVARVKNLGEHGIDLELTVWIKDPGAGEGEVRSDLLLDILGAFKTHGIHIPYPRRDVRVIATPETQITPLNSKV